MHTFGKHPVEVDGPQQRALARAKAAASASLGRALDIEGRLDGIEQRLEVGVERLAALVKSGRRFIAAGKLVLANKIIYPVRAWRPDFSATADMALLCHETCHIWQSQNIPRYNALRAGLEHLRYGDRVYEYSIRTHERLTDYRFEQQGQILQDWWSMNGNIFVPAELRERYAKVIYASISA